MKRIFTAFVVVCLFATAITGQEKRVLSIEESKTWRNHKVTLSPDGNWYTVLYSLTERPEKKEGAQKDSIQSGDSIYTSYGDNLKTDVLYICNSSSGIKYQIAKGSRPLFSDDSKWIAYQLTNKDDKKKDKTCTELKNLESGTTQQYLSSARFSFPEESNLFISSDKNSLLIYDLDEQYEHFIGNIGEYVIDKDVETIAYTIQSIDQRGNGIYLYHPKKRTTESLISGNYLFVDLTWNANKSGLAAIQYNKKGENTDFNSISILQILNIGTNKISSTVTSIDTFSGVPDNYSLAIDSSGFQNNLKWSQDGQRLFVRIHEYPKEETDEAKPKSKDSDKATVSVWHWKDEKLLSQQMKEAERKKHEVYDAILLLDQSKMIQISDEKLQRISFTKGNDHWAIGTDNRSYISDWNIARNDLYRVNLHTGERSLIVKAYPGSFHLSPSGENMILWKDQHYWSYGVVDDKMNNLTANLDLSFVNIENDHWGREPDYGFVGWVKGEAAIVVNHLFDIWKVALDPSQKTMNLTESSTDDLIRFRLDDKRFLSKSNPKERYIDLSKPLILNAFHTKTKHAGFYEWNKNKLHQLIFKPATFGVSRWGSSVMRVENSDAIIFKMGSYTQYPEAYLSNTRFENPSQLTTTNPQQEQYNWGQRILINYTNDDGVPLQGVLSIPDSYQQGQKLPMVVYSYEKLSQNRYSYSAPSIGGARITEMLYVSDGYLVLQPDIHFNVGSPHSDMHECIDAAIRQVIELGYVDERYIGYEGFS